MMNYFEIKFPVCSATTTPSSKPLHDSAYGTCKGVPKKQATPLFLYLHYYEKEADFETFRRVFYRLAEQLGTENFNWNCSSEVRRFCRRPEVDATTPTSGMTSQTNFFTGSISHRTLGVGKLKFLPNVQHVCPLIVLEP